MVSPVSSGVSVSSKSSDIAFTSVEMVSPVSSGVSSKSSVVSLGFLLSILWVIAEVITFWYSISLSIACTRWVSSLCSQNYLI